MPRAIRRIGLLVVCAMLSARPALAQVQLQGLFGGTNTASAATFYGAAIGFRLSFIEIDLETGRLKNVLPGGVLDAIHQLEVQHGLPIQTIASLPVSYGVGALRLIAPHGLIRPFVSIGFGVAHFKPRLDVSVDDISLGDIFGSTEFGSQTRPITIAGGGLRFDFHVINIEGGYRYVIIYSHFVPDTNLANDRILIATHVVYAGLALRF